MATPRVQCCAGVFSTFEPLHVGLRRMDPAFERHLLAGGVGEDVVVVLQEQKVLSLRIFRALKKDHMVRLLHCSSMPVGGHALLWEL